LRRDGRDQGKTPERTRYTFWEYHLRQACKRNAVVRLDHILLSRRLTPGLRMPGLTPGYEAFRPPAIMRRVAN
jgi:exonuclease III